MKDVKGKTAFITGGASGIGLGIAEALYDAGANLVLADIRDDHLKAAEEAFNDVARVLCLKLDVTDRAAYAAAAAEAEKKFGKIHMLFNNAGMGVGGPLSKLGFDDWDWGLGVMIGGVINGIQIVLPYIRKHGEGGHIVNTASKAALVPVTAFSIYGTAKAAMLGLMNVLHLEGARDNIRVNVLAPTAATRMTEALIPGDALALMAPETITPGLLFLVSEDAPSRVILGAGAGSFALTRIDETLGITLNGAENTPETVAARFAKIADPEGQEDLANAFEQTKKYVANAARARGLTLDWG